MGKTTKNPISNKPNSSECQLSWASNAASPGKRTGFMEILRQPEEYLGRCGLLVQEEVAP